MRSTLARDALCGVWGGAPFFLFLAWYFGQDVNWDLQNYHAYDAFALLHGRTLRDVMPAGPQSYLNPVPFLPPYLLRRLLGPLAGQLASSALQSLSIGALWAVARALSGRLVAIVATATGATAAMVLAEVGTSLDDLVLAATPLLAVRLILGGASTRRCLAAGLLTGIAAGFKLPMVVLSVALVAASLAAGPLRAAVAAGLGCAAGFLLTGGLWAGYLWLAFGNPLFPFLNNVFHAAAAPFVSFGDPRFHFIGLLHAIGVPLGVAEGRAPTAETPFRDVRGLACAIAAVAVLAVPRTPAPLRFIAVYLLAGLAAWLVLCPIQRYAVPLDMLGGAFVVLAAGTVPMPGMARAVAAASVALVLIATTQRADFFHRPWSATFVARPPGLIGPDSVELLLTVPLGYWVAATPHPLQALNLYPAMLRPGGKLDRRLDEAVASAGDRLRSVALDIVLAPTVRAEMERHGLALAPPCARAESAVWVATVFCRAVHSGPRADGASDLSTDRTVAFSAHGNGWIYEISGWDATEPDGTWATGPHARLAFLDRDTRPLVAVLRVSAVAGAPPRLLRIDAAGRTMTRQIGPLGIDVAIPACLGAAREAGGVTEIGFRVDDTRSMATLGLGPETRPLAFRLHDMTLRAAHPGECS